MKTNTPSAAGLPKILPAAAKPKHFTVEQIRAAVLAVTCQKVGKSSDLVAPNSAQDIDSDKQKT